MGLNQYETIWEIKWSENGKKKNMIKSSLHFRSSQIGVPLVLIGILMDVFSLYCIVFFRFQRLIGCVCVCVCVCVFACVSENWFIPSGDAWAIRKHLNYMQLLGPLDRRHLHTPAHANRNTSTQTETRTLQNMIHKRRPLSIVWTSFISLFVFQHKTPQLTCQNKVAPLCNTRGSCQQIQTQCQPVKHLWTAGR